MAVNYYPQSDVSTQRTMTIGELMEALRGFDPGLPVAFVSPAAGAFGPGVRYTIDAARLVSLPGKEVHHPATVRTDEETGEPEAVPAWVQTWHPWLGVEIG